MNRTYYVAFRFMTELLLAAAVYVFPLERKEGFWWKLPLGTAICMGASAGLGHWAQEAVLFNIFRYIILLLLVATLLNLCFELNRYGALFCAVSAYATQHFMIKLFRILLMASPMPLGLEVAAYLAHMAFWYATFYFIFSRRTRNQDFSQLVRREILILCGALVLCNIVFSVWVNGLEPTLSLSAKGIYTGYACLCCLLILIIQFGIFQRGKLQNEMDMMEYLWEQERRQYQISRDNMELISIKCHDMKHMLSALEPRISPGEKKELSGMIDFYDSTVKTGCEVLDVVLAEKSILCHQRNITLTCMADGAKLNFMAQSDLYSIFGNAIDNAIEAVSKLEEPERRIISLVVTAQKGAVVIHMENYCTGTVELRDGLPVTSKADKDYHGFGVKSMRLTAEKYNGTMSCSAGNNVFCLDILVPLPVDTM